jgi:hypothetical protein
MSALNRWDVIRIILGLGLVACNVGVWRGVSLEKSDDPWTKETGWILLVRSLALEAVLAFALLAADTTSSLLQKTQIANLSRETEVLRSENLKLEGQIQPRRLTPTQQSAIKKELASSAGKKVAISSYAFDVEGAALAVQIRDALRLTQITTDDTALMSIGGSGGEIAVGVHVIGKDPWLVKDLISALSKYVEVSDKAPFPRGFVGYVGSVTATSNSISPGAVNADASIFVGAKPIAQ